MKPRKKGQGEEKERERVEGNRVMEVEERGGENERKNPFAVVCS